jgi:predicted PurR-regulated permease PerM
MTREQTETTLERAAIWIGLAAGAFLAWELRPAILLAFGAVLLAIVFDLLTDAVCRFVKVSRPWGFGVATIIIIALIVVVLWLFGMNLYAQFGQVMKRISAGEASFNAMLGRYGLSTSLVSSGSSFLGDSVKTLVSTGTGLIEGAVIMLIASIYLAARPKSHREGAADFVPPGARSRFLRAVDAVGVFLKEWIMGQFVLMITVGVLATIAVAFIGLPNPIPLGLVAGLTEAVPYLGPWIGAIPALLVALTVSNGFGPVILTAVAYLGVHLIEGYIVGPLIQRWFVGIPPALMLLGIFASQLIFGLPGVILGAPMTVALFAGIKIVYLKQKVETPEKTISA